MNDLPYSTRKNPGNLIYHTLQCGAPVCLLSRLKQVYRSIVGFMVEISWYMNSGLGFQTTNL